ncbi:MAG TPA: peptidoglycan-binding domain-containing protein [Tepidisphaeraceae bacterium]
MSSPSSPRLKSSVGRSMANHRADVRLVQKLLNQQIKPPSRFLKEDGLFGAKTAAVIQRFQVGVCQMRQPTSGIDPDDATLNKLLSLHARSSASSTASVALLTPSVTSAAQSLEKHADVVREAFAEEKRESEFAEFWKTVAVQSAQQTTIIFGIITRAEEARMIANFYLTLREARLAPSEIKSVLQVIVKVAPKWRKESVEFLSDPLKGGGKFLKGLAGAGEKIEYVTVVVKVVNSWNENNLGEGVAEIYKFAMGKGVPWAGYIESFQSFVYSVLPEKAKGARAMKIIRAIDPIGLGGIAVDSVVTLVTAAVGHADERRLDRLVERMKDGPGRVFAEFGEDIADSVYDYFHPATNR